MPGQNSLKIGDVVRLKGGTQKMTVISDATGGGHVTCAWHAGAKSEKANYPVAALEIVGEADKK